MIRRAVLALALLVAACGVKNRPLPPEIVQPEAPDDLGAIASPEGVRVTWIRPTHYQGGKRMNDLGGFTIERAAGEGEPFKAVGKVEVDDQNRFRKERSMEWVDHDVTPGARGHGRRR